MTEDLPNELPKGTDRRSFLKRSPAMAAIALAPGAVVKAAQN
ncbi:unnamed protein product, partial [Rotaria sp. Silwood1]